MQITKHLSVTRLIVGLFALLTTATAWAFKTETPVSYTVSLAETVYNSATVTISDGSANTTWNVTKGTMYYQWAANDSHNLPNGIVIKPNNSVYTYSGYFQTLTSTTFTFTAPSNIAITGVTFNLSNRNVAASSTSSSDDGRTFAVTLPASTSFDGFKVTFGYISGSCGSNATWTLSKQNGQYTVLTISGSGAMSNYGHTTDGTSETWRTDAVWGWDITSVTIPDGITSIGDMAFIGCQQLSSLTIGSGVTSIGANSFDHCDALTEVTLPASVSTLGNAAFKNCVGLTRVNIQKSNGLVTLGSNGFSGTALQYIVAPSMALAVQYQSASNWSAHASKLRAVFANQLYQVTSEGGTAAYAITNETDLRTLAAAINADNSASGFTFRQTAHITLSSELIVIGASTTPWNGTYDGGGYTISGLHTTYGLFCQVSGTVKNMVLMNPTASVVLDYMSSVLIETLMARGTATNCYAYGADYLIGKKGGTVTNVGRARKVSLGSGIVSVTPATDITNGFIYNNERYYLQGLGLTLTSNLSVPTGQHIIYKSNGTALSGNSFTVGSSDVTLTAELQYNTYTVAFNGNGATGGSMYNQAFTYGTAQNLYDNGFSRTGYAFAGWATSANGDVVYTDKQSVNNLTATNGGTVNLYAKWTPITYTITYNNNGGTLTTSKTSFTIESEAITLDEPTRTGYTFVGWYTNEGLTGSAVTTIAAGSTGNKTFWAKWTPITYSVQFNGNGATGGTMSNQNFTYDVAQNLYDNGFSRTGYAFAGWATSANGDVVYTDKQSVNNLMTTNGGTVTLYAKWTPITYSITYNLNGGNLTTSKNSFTIESADIILDVPTRTGYTFGGWYTNEGLTGETVTTIAHGSTEDRTFWAKWELAGLTITSEADWNTFASMVNSGTTYSGYTVTLATDISVSAMVGTSETYSFQGTFNGGGNTITFTKTSAPEHTALFAYIKNATIQNLTVAGEVSSTEHHHLAALVSENYGTSYVNDVSITANVSCSASGEQYCGGFATGGAGIQFTGCVYSGKINVGTASGGFCGWGTVATTLTNCIFAPAADSSIGGGGNFCNNGIGTVSNSYYTLKVGDSTQGKQARTVTADEGVTISAVSPIGNATATYSTSGITAYAQGIVRGDTFYYGSGDDISLTLGYTPSTGYSFGGYTASAGTLTGSDNPYTLTMPDADVTISAIINDFTDDFESDVCSWTLINGDSTNAWAWGTATNNGGTHALYISNDGGTTNGYTNTQSATVYAAKQFYLAAGNYDFSYDWKAKGENNWDFLRVALVPVSVSLVATNDCPSDFNYNMLPSGWIALDGGSQLVGQTSWQTKTISINLPTSGVYHLVFIWRNDGSGGIKPSAAIDNVSFMRIGCTENVTGLSANEVSFTGATLTWTAGSASQWQVAYSTSSDFQQATAVTVDAATYALTGLQTGTSYYVRARSYCGGYDYGRWSTTATFTTKDAYAQPFDLATTDILHRSASLSWKGIHDSYNIRWRTSPYGKISLCEEGFENTSTFANWQAISSNTENDATVSDGMGIYTTSSSRSGNSCFRFTSNNWVDNHDYTQYLISPELSAANILEFYYKSERGAEEIFKVGYSSTGNSSADFTWGEMKYASGTNWQQFSQVIPEGTKYVAIKYCSEDMYYLLIDDICISQYEHTAGQWSSAASTTTPYSLTDLIPGTKYDWQVQGIYNDTPGKWSETATFTTLEGINTFAFAAGQQWTTWCDVTTWQLPDGLEAYTIGSIGSDDVTLNELTDKATVEGQQVSVIPAYTPVLLYRSEATEAGRYEGTFVDDGTPGSNVTNGVATTATDGFTFQGTVDGLNTNSFAPYYYPDGQTTYILRSGNFILASTNEGMAAHKCWLNVTNTARSARLAILFSETTGLREKGIVNSEKFATVPWYTLDGRKLDGKPTKAGLYIHGGSKVLVK